MDTQMANTIINVVVAKQTTSGIINTVEPVTLKNIPTIASGAKDIKDLNDVKITSPVNNDVLAYSNGFWINSNTAGGTTAYVNAIAQANIYANNAYTNAIAYVTNNSFVNTSQLSSNLSNYAALAGATFTGNVNISASANVSTDSNRLIFNNSTGSDSIRIRTVGSSTGWVLTSNGVDTIYFNNGSLQVPTVQATTSVISPLFTNDGGAGGRVFTANSASLSGMHLKANNTSWYLDNRGSNGNNVFGISNGGALAFAIQQSGEVGIGTTTPTAKLAIVNGTSPTTQHIYGTYTDGSNYERLAITANSSGNFIDGEKAGTGSARSLYLKSQSGQIFFSDGNAEARMSSGVWEFGNRSLRQVTDVNVGNSTVNTVISSTTISLINIALVGF